MGRRRGENVSFVSGDAGVSRIVPGLAHGLLNAAGRVGGEVLENLEDRFRLLRGADLRGEGLGRELASGGGLEGGGDLEAQRDDGRRRLLAGFDAGLVV